jgi:hypothetical protein
MLPRPKYAQLSIVFWSSLLIKMHPLVVMADLSIMPSRPLCVGLLGVRVNWGKFLGYLGEIRKFLRWILGDVVPIVPAFGDKRPVPAFGDVMIEVWALKYLWSEPNKGFCVLLLLLVLLLLVLPLTIVCHLLTRSVTLLERTLEE